MVDTICFFPFENVWKTGNEWRMKERLITSCDVSSFTQPLLPILVITLCFVELSVVTDCNKSNIKSMKILKMIGDLLTMTILCIWNHLVNYSAFLQIILPRTCQFSRMIGWTFLKANPCVNEKGFIILHIIIVQPKTIKRKIHTNSADWSTYISFRYYLSEVV